MKYVQVVLLGTVDVCAAHRLTKVLMVRVMNVSLDIMEHYVNHAIAGQVVVEVKQVIGNVMMVEMVRVGVVVWRVGKEPPVTNRRVVVVMVEYLCG